MTTTPTTTPASARRDSPEGNAPPTRPERPGDPSPRDGAAVVERLAALAHDQWAGWTRWMLDCLDSDQRVEHLARWRRQLATSYADLSERERESDRIEARKVLALLGSLARVPGVPVAAYRHLADAVRIEREARAVWLASLPRGACTSAPPADLLGAEAATGAALADLEGDRPDWREEPPTFAEGVAHNREHPMWGTCSEWLVICPTDQTVMTEVVRLDVGKGETRFAADVADAVATTGAALWSPLCFGELVPWPRAGA